MHHSVGLTKLLERKNPFEASAEEILTWLKTEEIQGRFPKRQVAILQYSKKLTQNPGSMQQADGLRLKEVGLSDREIHDLCAIVAYFAFVNRIADGLGVDLESKHADEPQG